jgi:hypothetical protein
MKDLNVIEEEEDNENNGNEKKEKLINNIRSSQKQSQSFTLTILIHLQILIRQ